MRYIASCSFGKDSLAMIIKLMEMQKHSFNTFKPNLTIDQIEARFIEEERQLKWK